MLQQAGFRKGERGTLADDDVVQYPHIDERQRGLQLLGQHAIRAGRLGDARRMLVGEDHRGGIQLQHTLYGTTCV